MSTATTQVYSMNNNDKHRLGAVYIYKIDNFTITCSAQHQKLKFQLKLKHFLYTIFNIIS